MLEPMKKALKFTVGAAAGLGLLAILLAVVCLDTVDYRPYFREPYYAETAARLRVQAQTNQLHEGILSAGFGRARLTPTVNATNDDPAHGTFRSLPLAGYGNRHGRAAAGVHDDLFVKAVALRVDNHLAVMLGADALIIPPEVTDEATARLARENGLSREQIYLSATHTHCSLGGWGQGWATETASGPFQPGVRGWFADRIVEAVQNAIADLKPARLGQGSFATPHWVRNRLVGGLGRIDPEFAYAVIQQNGGRPSVLGVFGAHATVQPPGMMEFSADYPGAWEKAVEEATGGTAIFLGGGVGSHSPAADGNNFASAERMGRALARELAADMANVVLTNRVTLGLLGLEVTMPPLGPRLADNLRLRPWLAAKLLPARPQVFLQVLRLNDTVWAATPCDFSGELALGLKDAARARGHRAVITSFNGDYIGYVVPHRYYHLNSYESRVMSFYGPNVPDYFVELIRTMSGIVDHDEDPG